MNATARNQCPTPTASQKRKPFGRRKNTGVIEAFRATNQSPPSVKKTPAEVQQDTVLSLLNLDFDGDGLESITGALSANAIEDYSECAATLNQAGVLTEQDVELSIQKNWLPTTVERGFRELDRQTKRLHKLSIPKDYWSHIVTETYLDRISGAMELINSVVDKPISVEAFDGFSSIEENVKVQLKKAGIRDDDSLEIDFADFDEYGEAVCLIVKDFKPFIFNSWHDLPTPLQPLLNALMRMLPHWMFRFDPEDTFSSENDAAEEVFQALEEGMTPQQILDAAGGSDKFVALFDYIEHYIDDEDFERLEIVLSNLVAEAEIIKAGKKFNGWDVDDVKRFTLHLFKAIRSRFPELLPTPAYKAMRQLYFALTSFPADACKALNDSEFEIYDDESFDHVGYANCVSMSSLDCHLEMLHDAMMQCGTQHLCAYPVEQLSNLLAVALPLNRTHRAMKALFAAGCGTNYCS